MKTYETKAHSGLPFVCTIMVWVEKWAQILLGFPSAMVAAYIIARIITVFQDFRRMKAMLGDMPGPRPLPLVGNVLSLVAPRDKFWGRVVSLVESYAPTFRFWVGLTPFVVLTDPRDLEHVINNTKFNDKSTWYSMLRFALGSGLIVLSGDAWRRHRKAAAPSMHQKVLALNVEVFHRKAQDMCGILEQHASSEAAFDAKELADMVSMDAVCETLLSSDLSAHRSALKCFVNEKNHACELVADRVYNPWLLSDWLYSFTSRARENLRIEKLTNKFVDLIIESKRKQQQQQKQQQQATNGSKRASLLEHVLADPSVAALLSDEELREEAKAMVIAGEGTVAHALSFTMLMLAMHPDVQSKVHQELDDVLGVDPERPVTEAELPHLTYMERVILETLRLFPVVSLYGRNCPEDIVLPCGYAVPRGTQLLVFCFRTHRDPALYPDPLRFDPDRFLPEQIRSRPQLSFLAFSAGPRSCIGQRYALVFLKTVLSTMLRRFRLCRAPGDKRTIQDLPLEIGVILTLKGGFPVTVTTRDVQGELGRAT